MTATVGKTQRQDYQHDCRPQAKLGARQIKAPQPWFMIYSKRSTASSHEFTAFPIEKSSHQSENWQYFGLRPWGWTDWNEELTGLPGFRRKTHGQTSQSQHRVQASSGAGVHYRRDPSRRLPSVVVHLSFTDRTAVDGVCGRLTSFMINSAHNPDALFFGEVKRIFVSPCYAIVPEANL